jgi:hypothetical protein
MKYVILRHRTYGTLDPVLAMTHFSHAQLAEAFARTHIPASAGFCDKLPSGRWQVSGRSISLDLGPAEGDALLLEVLARVTLTLDPELSRRVA